MAINEISFNGFEEAEQLNALCKGLAENLEQMNGLNQEQIKKLNQQIQLRLVILTKNASKMLAKSYEELDKNLGSVIAVRFPLIGKQFKAFLTALFNEEGKLKDLDSIEKNINEPLLSIVKTYYNDVKARTVNFFGVQGVSTEDTELTPKQRFILDALHMSYTAKVQDFFYADKVLKNIYEQYPTFSAIFGQFANQLGDNYKEKNKANLIATALCIEGKEIAGDIPKLNGKNLANFKQKIGKLYKQLSDLQMEKDGLTAKNVIALRDMIEQIVALLRELGAADSVTLRELLNKVYINPLLETMNNIGEPFTEKSIQAKEQGQVQESILQGNNIVTNIKKFNLAQIKQEVSIFVGQLKSLNNLSIYEVSELGGIVKKIVASLRELGAENATLQKILKDKCITPLLETMKNIGEPFTEKSIRAKKQVQARPAPASKSKLGNSLIMEDEDANYDNVEKNIFDEESFVDNSQQPNLISDKDYENEVLQNSHNSSSNLNAQSSDKEEITVEKNDGSSAIIIKEEIKPKSVSEKEEGLNGKPLSVVLSALQQRNNKISLLRSKEISDFINLNKKTLLSDASLREQLEDSFKAQSNQKNFKEFYQAKISERLSEYLSELDDWVQIKAEIDNVLNILSSVNGANLSPEGVVSLQKMVGKILQLPIIQQLIEFIKKSSSKCIQNANEIDLFLAQVSKVQKVMNKIMASHNLYTISDNQFLKKTVNEILSSKDNDRKLSLLLVLADYLDPKVSQVLGGGTVIANKNKSKDLSLGDMAPLAHNAFCHTLGFKGKVNHAENTENTEFRTDYLALTEAIADAMGHWSESDENRYMIVTKMNNGRCYLGAIAGDGPEVRPAVGSEYAAVDKKREVVAAELKNFLSKPKSLVDRFATTIGLKRIDEPLKTKHKVIVGAMAAAGVIGAGVVIVGGVVLATAFAVPEAVGVGIVGGIIATGAAIVAPSVVGKVVSAIKSGVKSLFGKKPPVNPPNQSGLSDTVELTLNQKSENNFDNVVFHDGARDELNESVGSDYIPLVIPEPEKEKKKEKTVTAQSEDNDVAFLKNKSPSVEYDNKAKTGFLDSADCHSKVPVDNGYSSYLNEDGSNSLPEYQSIPVSAH